MPSTVTHSYFAMNVLEKLDDKTREFIRNDENNFRVFAQSMDSFHFYDVLNIIKKKDLNIINFSEVFHSNKTGELLITLTERIKNKKAYNNPHIMSFLYGLICHYCLDSSAHPYIVYKSGELDKKDKETWKYNAKHHEIEVSIDQYLINKKDKIKPNKYKHYDICLDFNDLDEESINIINYSFNKVHNFNNFYKHYTKSIYDMKFIFKHLRYDRYGILKNLYYIFDLVVPNPILRSKFLSYAYTIKNANYYLNENNKIWYNPADKNISSNKSFMELYDCALDECVLIINSIKDYLYNDKIIDLKKVYKNKSYITGLDSNKENKLKYFEY